MPESTCAYAYSHVRAQANGHSGPSAFRHSRLLHRFLRVQDANTTALETVLCADQNSRTSCPMLGASGTWALCRRLQRISAEGVTQVCGESGCCLSTSLPSSGCSESRHSLFAVYRRCCNQMGLSSLARSLLFALLHVGTFSDSSQWCTLRLASQH